MEYLNEKLLLLQLCEELILKEVDKICVNNGINYFVGGGTAIGQRRHGGFIPWDDDIDINMSRSDYNKFLSIASSELPSFLFLQNHNTDSDFSKLYSKIRLKNTKFVEYQYRNSKMEQGIYIDVFPMDISLNDDQYLRKMDKRIGLYYSLYDYRINPSSNQPMVNLKDRLRNVIKHIIHFLLCVFPKKFYSNSYYSFLLKNKVDSDYLADYATVGGKSFVVDSKLVFPVKRGTFDMIEVNIPNDIDAFLRLRYGDSYMTLPPIEQRINHSPYELDFGEYTKDKVISMIRS